MNPIIRYFSAERLWCTGGAIIAVASIGIACWFLFRVRQPFQSGMAWPFLGLGILFFTICLSVAIRSTSDIARVTSMVKSNLPGIASEEQPRMSAVMRTFTIIIAVETAFVVASIAILLLADPSPVWRGVTTGMLVQAGWLLIFDLFARYRGAQYYEYLNGLMQKV
jgi:hypothetical protein